MFRGRDARNTLSLPMEIRGRNATKEANVLIKSGENAKTSPSRGVFAIFRKFRLARLAFKVVADGQTNGGGAVSFNHLVPPPFHSAPPRSATLRPLVHEGNKRSGKNKRTSRRYLAKQIVASYSAREFKSFPRTSLFDPSP